MLIIRLKRVGKKNHPHYRMVVAEKSRAVSGKFIEILGSVDPHTKTRALKKERILHWLSSGAQVSNTAYNILAREGILKGGLRKIRIRKKKIKGEEKTEAQAPASQDVKSVEGKGKIETTAQKTVEQKDAKVGKKKKEKKRKPEEKQEEKQEKVKPEKKKTTPEKLESL